MRWEGEWRSFLMQPICVSDSPTMLGGALGPERFKVEPTFSSGGHTSTVVVLDLVEFPYPSHLPQPMQCQGLFSVKMQQKRPVQLLI